MSCDELNYLSRKIMTRRKQAKPRACVSKRKFEVFFSSFSEFRYERIPLWIYEIFRPYRNAANCQQNIRQMKMGKRDENENTLTLTRTESRDVKQHSNDPHGN